MESITDQLREPVAHIQKLLSSINPEDEVQLLTLKNALNDFKCLISDHIKSINAVRKHKELRERVRAKLERACVMYKEWENGDTLKEIGKRHGVSSRRVGIYLRLHEHYGLRVYEHHGVCEGRDSQEELS